MGAMHGFSVLIPAGNMPKRRLLAVASPIALGLTADVLALTGRLDQPGSLSSGDLRALVPPWGESWPESCRARGRRGGDSVLPEI